MRVSRFGLALTLVAFTSFGADLPPLSEPPPPPPPPPPSEYAPPPSAPSQAQQAPAPVELRRGREMDRFEYDGVVPPGFHLVSHVRTGMLVWGSILFGGGYLLSAYAGLATGQGWALLPVAGSVIAAGNLSSNASVAGPLVVFTGVLLAAAQAGGITLFVFSLAKPQQWLERNSGVRMSLVPGSAGSTAGATLVGRF